jgi:hypothetical protein
VKESSCLPANSSSVSKQFQVIHPDDDCVCFPRFNLQARIEERKPSCLLGGMGKRKG